MLLLSFHLLSFTQSTPQPPPPCGLGNGLYVCDDVDSDGISTFNLDNQDELNVIFCPLGESLVSKTFHLSLVDAANEANPIENFNLYENISNPQIIYVRGVFDDNSVLVRELLLSVFGNPVDNEISDLVSCSPYPNEDASFLLRIKDSEITDGNLCSSVDYFETLADAENNTSAIQLVDGYYNNLTNPQTIYYREENTETNVFIVGSFEAIASWEPLVGFNLQQEVCDFDDDGFAIFDLNRTINEINAIAELDGYGNVEVTFHETQDDADTGENAVVINYTNSVANNDMLFIRIKRLDYGCSYTGALLDLIVVQNDSANTTNVINPSPLIGCDDDADGFAEFNLAQKINELLNGLDSSYYNTSFYETIEDAAMNTNVIESTTYINNIANEQTIYFRVEDPNNGCYKVGEFNLIINTELSSVIEPTPLIECGYIEVNGDDGYAYFDLESKNEEILNGLNPEIYDVLYYDTQLDADMGTNAITSMPYRNVLPYSQILYVRVNNTETNCFVNTTLDLVIEDCQISCDEEPVNIETCFMLNSEVHTFSNENDAPLTLRFNSGSIQGLGDTVLNIYGSDGETVIATISNDDGNGDLSNMVFTSDGSSISFSFSGTYVCLNDDLPLNFDVFCTNTVGFLKIGAFIDDNIDSVLNEGESYFNNGYFTYEKNNDGNVITVQSSYNQITIVSESEDDSYAINYYLNDFPEICYNLTLSEFNDVSVQNAETIILDFPIVSEQPCQDLAVYLVNPSASPRPGFNYINHLYYKNLGLETISAGSINFIGDDLVDLIGYNFFDVTDTIITNGNELTLEFSNLEPGETRYIGVNLNCLVTTDLGVIVTNMASYTTTTNDIVAENNVSTLSEIVIGSYDPNDKMEAQGPQIVYDDFITTDEYLYYTIRFQNVGTAEAIFVRIEDELDAQLDEATFQMIRSSHDYQVTRTGNSLEWFFDDIDLPAEQDDAEGSNGFVYFKIKPKSGYTLGDVIPNNAAIYFDFNPPIITNIFNTTFVEPLSVDDFESIGFTMYPNPAKDKLILTLSNNIYEDLNLSIYDIQGKQIGLSKILNSTTIELDVSKFDSGVYFVKLRNQSVSLVKKLIIN